MADTATAKLKTLNISPRKVRFVADVIKGMHVSAALAQLDMMPHRSTRPLAKLIRSAVANASEKKMDTEKLVIKSLVVDQGPAYRRIQPRSRGRATPIRKTTSHITIELVEDPAAAPAGFVFPEREKKAKESKRPKPVQEKPKADFDEEKKARRGFVDKVFRRKAV